MKKDEAVSNKLQSYEHMGELFEEGIEAVANSIKSAPDVQFLLDHKEQRTEIKKDFEALNLLQEEIEQQMKDYHIGRS